MGSGAVTWQVFQGSYEVDPDPDDKRSICHQKDVVCMQMGLAGQQAGYVVLGESQTKMLSDLHLPRHPIAGHTGGSLSLSDSIQSETPTPVHSGPRVDSFCGQQFSLLAGQITI